MLKVSKLTDYGTVLMTFLAQQPGRVFNAREITEHTHVALPTVSKLLKLLTKQGLLLSQRGAKGGYVLARPPEDITVAQIIAALEGDLGLTECAHSDSTCVIEPQCHIRHNWRVINTAIHVALDSVSLAQMAKPLQQHIIEVSQIRGLAQKVKDNE